MPAVAITDHGNMYGAYHFYCLAKKKGIKPIIGCEFYMADDLTVKKRRRKAGVQPPRAYCQKQYGLQKISSSSIP